MDGLIVVFVAAAGVAFIAASPFAVADYRVFVDAMIYNLRHYSYGGYAHHNTGLTTWENFLYYLREFQSLALSAPIIWAAFAGCLAGFFVAWRRHLLVFAFAAFYIWYFSGMKAHFFRNMLPILPMVALLAAMPFALISRLPLRGRARVVPTVLALILAAVIVVPLFAQGRAASREAAAETDPRGEMLDYILTKLPADAKVAIDQNLHFYFPPGTDRKRLVEMNVFDKPFGHFKNNGFQYVVAAESYGFSEPSEANTEIGDYLTGRFAGVPVVTTIGGEALTFNRCPSNPRVVLRKFADYSEPAAPKNFAAGLAMTTFYRVMPDFSYGSQSLSSEGRFTANVDVTTPTSELVLTACGKPADDEAFPQVQISVVRAGTTERTFITKKQEIAGWNSYPEIVLPCKLSPGQYAIDIDFLNGDKWPVASATFQRRTVSIKSLKLR